MPSYLEDLTLRLARLVSELPESARQRHGDFFLAAQQSDGGFAGREGGSDLYYTGFGLRGLALLGLLDGPVAERAASFLTDRMTGNESIIDFLSLMYGATLLDLSAGIDIFANASAGWKSSVAETLNKLRRDDGGFAKGPSGKASSTYHTFLVMLCFELIGLPLSQPEKVVSFIRSRTDGEGGFREIRVSKRAGTNPTAAAIAVLRILDSIDGAIREGTIDFLVNMQTDEGGLRANTRIPIADLLSTFTGYLTLVDLNGTNEIDRGDALKYVQSLEQETGGFHGAEWDFKCDVEYTFYGLSALALLSGA